MYYEDQCATNGKTLPGPQLDPLSQKLTDLARENGYLTASLEARNSKVWEVEQKLKEEQDSVSNIQRDLRWTQNDRDTYQRRALEAENKLASALKKLEAKKPKKTKTPVKKEKK